MIEKVIDKPVQHVVDKIVERPEVTENLVEKPVKREFEKVVEVPVLIEKLVEKEIKQVVERVVEKPVTVEVEKVVEKPVYVEVEKVIEKPVERVVEVVVEKPVFVRKVVEKEVERVIEESEETRTVTHEGLTGEDVRAHFLDRGETADTSWIEARTGQHPEGNIAGQGSPALDVPGRVIDPKYAVTDDDDPQDRGPRGRR
ncbi:hypothetical protein GOHSU_50_00160 [Gordonia hirsuta DSM 44140 = NBRC 16056]|uniref:Uncharacterized protein n=1 Tax=Gordonia hirsuta DSM 44140 = NBRC 16056 TaxID=1121927 RepID=L7LFF0_9ACTN|nr:hypothetical protein GOHSU_50_00160 [Gordonia hirsuta DSM 44140 = NBRC 16056]